MMTTKIYVQTTTLSDLPFRHTGIWIVQNGQTTIIDGKASGSLGPTNVDPTELFGNLLLEKTIIQNVPDDGASDGVNEFDFFNLNEKTFSTEQEASDYAADILAYYNNAPVSSNTGPPLIPPSNLALTR